MSDKKKDIIHSIFGPELAKLKKEQESKEIISSIEEVAAKVKAYEIKSFVKFAQKHCTDQEILEIFLEMLPGANVETCGLDLDDDDIEQFVIYTGVKTF